MQLVVAICHYLLTAGEHLNEYIRESDRATYWRFWQVTIYAKKPETYVCIPLCMDSIRTQGNNNAQRRMYVLAWHPSAPDKQGPPQSATQQIARKLVCMQWAALYLTFTYSKCSHTISEPSVSASLQGFLNVTSSSCSTCMRSEIGATEPVAACITKAPKGLHHDSTVCHSSTATLRSDPENSPPNHKQQKFALAMAAAEAISACSKKLVYNIASGIQAGSSSAPEHREHALD